MKWIERSGKSSDEDSVFLCFSNNDGQSVHVYIDKELKTDTRITTMRMDCSILPNSAEETAMNDIAGEIKTDPTHLL